MDSFCAVCYESLADLAKASRESESSETKEFYQLTSQCTMCATLMCNDCLVDWAVTTIEKLHVPEGWGNVDLLKLKCSS